LDARAQEDCDAICRAGDKLYAALGPVMDASFDNQLEGLRAGGATVPSLILDWVSQWEDGAGVPGIQTKWGVRTGQPMESMHRLSL
jgi:hypothetical protein